MGDAIQVAFLCIVSLLGGGLASIGLVVAAIFAARRNS